jgi:hypothetical protein
MITPSCPAQGTSCMHTAIINKDKKDAKEEEDKGKGKEDTPLAYKPESLNRVDHVLLM